MRKTKVKKMKKFSKKNKTKHCKKEAITDEVIRIRSLIEKLQTKKTNKTNKTNKTKNNLTKRKGSSTTRRAKST